MKKHVFLAHSNLMQTKKSIKSFNKLQNRLILKVHIFVYVGKILKCMHSVFHFPKLRHIFEFFQSVDKRVES
jgi:hypothetical protein